MLRNVGYFYLRNATKIFTPKKNTANTFFRIYLHPTPLIKYSFLHFYLFFFAE